jgi:hypothetical protein
MALSSGGGRRGGPAIRIHALPHDPGSVVNIGRGGHSYSWFGFIIPTVCFPLVLLGLIMLATPAQQLGMALLLGLAIAFVLMGILLVTKRRYRAGGPLPRSLASPDSSPNDHRYGKAMK